MSNKRRRDKKVYNRSTHDNPPTVQTSFAIYPDEFTFKNAAGDILQIVGQAPAKTIRSKYHVIYYVKVVKRQPNPYASNQIERDDTYRIYEHYITHLLSLPINTRNKSS